MERITKSQRRRIEAGQLVPTKSGGVVGKSPGRPRKSMQEFRADPVFIERCAEEGLIREDIAYLLKMSPPTLARLFLEDPEYEIAYQRGRANLKDDILSIILDMIRKHKAPPAVLIFALKNLCGWTDSPKVVEREGPDAVIVYQTAWSGPPPAQAEQEEPDDADVVDVEPEPEDAGDEA